MSDQISAEFNTPFNIKETVQPQKTVLLAVPKYPDYSDKPDPNSIRIGEPIDIVRPKSQMWADLAHTLTRWGYIPQVLLSKRDPFSLALSQIDQSISQQIIATSNNDEELALLWPRDTLTRYGNQVFITEGPRSRIGKEIITKLYGNERSQSAVTSPLGEGGLISVAGNAALVSEEFSRTHAQDLVVLRQDYNIETVPICNDKTALGQRMQRNLHIDTEIQLGLRRDNKHFLTVTPDYFNRYSEDVYKICRAFSIDMSDLFIVNDDDPRLVNFLQLPKGQMVISMGIKDDFLNFAQRQVGSNNVYELPMNPYFDYRTGGGIRCMSQVI